MKTYKGFLEEAKETRWKSSDKRYTILVRKGSNGVGAIEIIGKNGDFFYGTMPMVKKDKIIYSGYGDHQKYKISDEDWKKIEQKLG